jgi:hypothetical protein
MPHATSNYAETGQAAAVTAQTSAQRLAQLSVGASPRSTAEQTCDTNRATSGPEANRR